MTVSKNDNKLKFWVEFPITEVTPDWTCPCGCGRTAQQLAEAGAQFTVLIARGRPPFDRQGRSRGTSRRPARAKAGRSDP